MIAHPVVVREGGALHDTTNPHQSHRSMHRGEARFKSNPNVRYKRTWSYFNNLYVTVLNQFRWFYICRYNTNEIFVSTYFTLSIKSYFLGRTLFRAESHISGAYRHAPVIDLTNSYSNKICFEYARVRVCVCTFDTS